MTKLKIVLGTNEGRDHFVDHFFSNVPLFVERMTTVISGNYEIAQIQDAFCDLGGRFVYFQDSMFSNHWESLVNDLRNAPETAYIFPRPAMYSMIYSSRVLEKMEFPVVTDKESSIFWETTWVDQYELEAKRLDLSVPVLYPEANDGDALANSRYYYISGDPTSRLHLRSRNGEINKAKATYR